MLAIGLGGCSSPEYLVRTPVLYAGGADDPFAQVPPSLRETTVSVIYATDRLQEKPREDGVLRYGIGRSHQLTIGVSRVEFSPVRDWDQLVEASRQEHRSQAIRTRIVETTPMAALADPTRPPAIQDGRIVEDIVDLKTNEEAVARLHDLLRQQLARTSRRDVFIYVHGYNNTFEVATARIVQLWHFLGRVGVPVIYSWPAGAKGLIRGYTRDRESGEFSTFHLKQFLTAVAACPDVQRIHIIAHSRGTDVATSAVRELHLFLGGNPEVTREKLKLGHVVLAAPDLDMEVAAQRLTAERIGLATQRTTVYLNARDRAIGVADWLFESARRVGRAMFTDFTPYQRDAFDRLSNISFIDVKVKTDLLGHGYFVSNPLVLSDLVLLLRDDRYPGAEHGRPLLDRPGAFWELNNGYADAVRPGGTPSPSADQALKRESSWTGHPYE
jgi:esterase/lipase superfamily enzyme